MSKILTLTTDFGNNFFVGIMKGVILSINNQITIVDIAHNINKFNILQGKFILENSFFYFPEGSVHVAVIDPGVGSNRKGIIVETDKYYFVGPDNGLFSFIPKNQINNIYEIIYKSDNISSTFHGRDIFAPVAANIISLNKIFDVLGKKINYSNTYTFGKFNSNRENKIIYIDDFGNIILNLKKDELLKLKNWTLTYKNKLFKKISKSYYEVEKGDLLLLINSLGYLEIAVREGNASKKLDAKVGDEYYIRCN